MATYIETLTPQLLFADHATDFGAAPATAANSLIVGTPTDVQMDLGGLAASGGCYQSAKTASLGATRPVIYRVDACIEFAVAPSDKSRVEMWWAGSPNSGATGQPGGLGSSQASVTETDGLLAQFTKIGALVCRANVVNIGEVGLLMPTHLYGTLIVLNNADQAFAATADETHITFTPIGWGDSG